MLLGAEKREPSLSVVSFVTNTMSRGLQKSMAENMKYERPCCCSVLSSTLPSRVREWQQRHARCTTVFPKAGSSAFGVFLFSAATDFTHFFGHGCFFVCSNFERSRGHARARCACILLCRGCRWAPGVIASMGRGRGAWGLCPPCEVKIIYYHSGYNHCLAGESKKRETNAAPLILVLFAIAGGHSPQKR